MGKEVYVEPVIEETIGYHFTVKNGQARRTRRQLRTAPRWREAQLSMCDVRNADRR